ncbi:MAG: porin family protein [Muribaculaceae bacterium]|nr:porin family protein [Muribaculaceae bacterium]
MKKFLLIAAFVAFVSFGASAQQGEAAVGLNFNFSPCLESGVSLNHIGLAAKFQYNITDALRGEIQAGYDFKKTGVSVFTGAVNMHYLFSLGQKFKLYPIFGLGYGNVHEDWGELGSTSTGKFLLNVGAGGEVRLAEHFAMSLELKYQYMKNFGRLPISLGFAYKF